MIAMPKTRAALETVPLAERPDVLLDRALELSAMPASTQELLRLTRSDDAELGPVVEALGKNPSLAAAVLRVANSTTYGQSRTIADLHRAVMVIGMQELHDVVAGTAMLAAFGRPDPLSQHLQSTAILSAVISQKLVASLGGGSPSTAYLSGLLCEIGALACLALDPGYADLHRTSEGDARRRFDEEIERYGSTTAAIGGRVLAASALPTEVAEAVATTGLEPRSGPPKVGHLVALARLAASALLQATQHGDPDILRSELTVSTSVTGLEEVDPDMLMHACLAAAKAAELTLSGKLAQAHTPANDVVPQGAGPTVRIEPRPRTGMYVAMCLAAAMVGALATWLLTR